MIQEALQVFQAAEDAEAASAATGSGGEAQLASNAQRLAARTLAHTAGSCERIVRKVQHALAGGSQGRDEPCPPLGPLCRLLRTLCEASDGAAGTGAAEEALLLALFDGVLRPPHFVRAAEAPTEDAMHPAVAALWSRPAAPADGTSWDCVVICSSIALQLLMRRPPSDAPPRLSLSAPIERLCRALVAAQPAGAAQRPLATQSLLQMAAVALRG